MQKYANKIENIWTIRDKLAETPQELKDAAEIVNQVIDLLNMGKIRVAHKEAGLWQVNEWVKKAILLYFQFSSSKIWSGECIKWYDKIAPKFGLEATRQDFITASCRIVPGAFIRNGAYIGKNTVIMPSFVNIGAYIGDNTMIDTWATVGSCAQIGHNCHISGGAGIGGVLEPLQNKPVIIEDNCFIGARSEIVEGVEVGEGSVISMGVFIGASTKIVYRNSGEVIYGKIPPYSVVVPGCMPPDADGATTSQRNLPSLYCAVIIKQVDASTRAKTSINELLRG